MFIGRVGSSSAPLLRDIIPAVHLLIYSFDSFCPTTFYIPLPSTAPRMATVNDFLFACRADNINLFKLKECDAGCDVGLCWEGSYKRIWNLSWK